MSLVSELDRCWPWLEASQIFGKTHEKHHILGLILCEKAFFFPGRTSAILAEIVTYPACKPRLNLWLMGGNLEEIKQMLPRVYAFGKARNCDRVIACGRRGWLRALDGFEEYGTRRFRLLKDDNVSRH